MRAVAEVEVDEDAVAALYRRPVRKKPARRLCADCRIGIGHRGNGANRCEACQRLFRKEIQGAKAEAERMVNPPHLGDPIELALPTGQEAFVYRLWNSAAECLYVGKTTQLVLLRVMEHRYQPWWPEVARADYVAVLDGDLDWAEECQIAELRPKHNVAKNRAGRCETVQTTPREMARASGERRDAELVQAPRTGGTAYQLAAPVLPVH
jgi:hypothetical protein